MGLKDYYPKIEYSGADFVQDTRNIRQRNSGERYFRKMQVIATMIYTHALNKGATEVCESRSMDFDQVYTVCISRKRQAAG